MSCRCSTQSFIGVDLHKCTVTLTAVDPAGAKHSRLKISTKSTGKIEDWLLDLPRPSHLAVEACPFVEWFIDRFRRASSGSTSPTPRSWPTVRGKRRKTDRNDSLDIAQRWFLANRHLLGPVQQQAFADFLDVLMLTERQRERLRREIIFATRSQRFAPLVALLMSVPGIGDIWAAIIAAEIGPFDRFPNADTLEFWAGMTADMKESAGRTQSGNITKAGSVTLRWALCQAAVTLCQCDARQEAIRQRLAERIGKPKANVAMGRRLLQDLVCHGPRRQAVPAKTDPRPHHGGEQGPPRKKETSGLTQEIRVTTDGGIFVAVASTTVPSDW